MRPHDKEHGERGAIAVLAAVLFLVIGGFLALSINVGHKMNAKAQLQGAFDAAALAGAAALDGSTASISSARSAAVTFAIEHHLDTVPVGLGATDVQVGYWDKSRRAFYTDGQSVRIGDAIITLDPGSTAQYYNAVKLTAATDGAGSHNQPLDVWFSGLLGGRSTMQVAAGALGMGGGPCSNGGCTLPLMVPSCALVDGGGNVACGTVVTLSFNHGTGKDVMLADISQPSRTVTHSEEIQQMNDGAACRNPTVRVGDVVKLGTSVDFDSLVQAKMTSPNNIVCSSGTPPAYLGCPRREMAVVNVGTNCNASLPSSATVIGFVHVVVTRTQTSPPAMSMYIDCNATSNATTTGCASFGYGSRRLRLVQ